MFSTALLFCPDIVVGAAIAEVPLLERDPHHAGHHEESAGNAEGVWPHTQEGNLNWYGRISDCCILEFTWDA